MSAQAELAFAKTYINTLSSQPITYDDDYQQPPEHSLKRVPVLPVDLPPPPQPRPSSSAPSTSQISLTFKSAKPPASFTLSVHTADSISSIKTQLASQPHAPPADAQRLLLKGKALADSKLLKEYAINDGDTVNLMIKPGFHWDPNSTSTAPPAPAMDVDASSPGLGPSPSGGKGRTHSRIPSVVLSPSPSAESPSVEPVDIDLSLDPLPPSPSADVSSYHASLAKPEFWERLYAFLEQEFKIEDDALRAFEDFLRASKNTLTAGEVAKIRDYVGVAGMAGT